MPTTEYHHAFIHPTFIQPNGITSLSAASIKLKPNSRINSRSGHFMVVTSSWTLFDQLNKIWDKWTKGKASLVCGTCKGSVTIPCPNCEALGFYITYGKKVRCNCCHGSGRVLCRKCFKGDPWDLQGIRNFMRSLPD